MSDYQPTSRRPIADLFRASARRAVAGCVAIGISADMVSYCSIIAAGAAGICFWQASQWPALLVVGAALCYLRLWLNMLDGMVALESKTASLRGELLNDLPDRISDVLIFVGAGHSGLCHVLGGYWAAIFALLVAYVGMFGQALGIQREFSGVMSKPWRMVTLSVGAVATALLIWLHGASPKWAGLTVLDWTFLLIIAGCVQSIWVRIARILRGLRRRREGT